MKMHLIKQRASETELQEMMEELENYIKLAVDVKRNILVGGGEYHADCEALLLEDGSRQEDIWGADWYPDSRTIGFGALINIRPRQNNYSMEIEDPAIRTSVESLARKLLDIEAA